MEWNEKLQNIIDYVEEHLQRDEEPIDYNEISRMAGCSFDFFQKVFSYMNGMSFAEYVRSRKMTLAGYDLKSTDMKVIEISYKYGYHSPTSFTKAFQQFHGVSPKEARYKNVQLHVMPKMQIFDQQRYSWRIEQKESLRLIGKSIEISCVNNEHYEKIPEFWSECQKNGVYSTLISLDTSRTKGVFGVLKSYQDFNIEYSIMVISEKEIPNGYEELMLPELTWVIFDCRGRAPESIHKGWQYLYEEWLIKYPFQHAPYPELEWYSQDNIYSENDLSQIWIPIIKESK